MRKIFNELEENMKKNLFLIVGIGVCLLYLNYIYYVPVKYAILGINAYWKNANESVLIISYDENGLGSFYKKGLTREYVTLIGRNPYNELSDRLAKNRIIVEGEFQNDMSEFYNEKIFKVKNWDILFPIKREYSGMDYEKSRWISPLFYLDQFDLETGDLREYKNAEFSITDYEAKFLACKYETKYFVVTPEVVDNEILWHRVYYIFSQDKLSASSGFEWEVSDKTIHLAGNNIPENYLNDDVLFNGSIQKYVNQFLICGTLQDDTIDIESWKIITPFENKTTGYGKYFLGDDEFIK